MDIAITSFIEKYAGQMETSEMAKILVAFSELKPIQPQEALKTLVESDGDLPEYHLAAVEHQHEIGKCADVIFGLASEIMPAVCLLKYDIETELHYFIPITLLETGRRVNDLPFFAFKEPFVVDPYVYYTISRPCIGVWSFLSPKTYEKIHPTPKKQL